MKRDSYIDLLRVIGLTFIILAHVNAPKIINDIRCFDVPLMVFVSGLSFSGIKTTYSDYLIKRFIRLYKPVAIFLTVFFSGCYILQIMHLPIIDLSIDKIFGSYALLQEPSIGFVWIIRVFILMAFIAPLCYRYCQNISTTKAIILLFLTITVQTTICHLSQNINNDLYTLIVKECVLYTTGYSIFLILGMILRRESLTVSSCYLYSGLFLSSGLILLLMILPNEYHILDYKYPPSNLFLIWGVGICLLLWGLKPNIKTQAFGKILHESILYISKNSIWIYLLHIPFVFLINHYVTNQSMWSIRWVIVYSLAICTYIITDTLTKTIKSFNKIKKWRFFTYYQAESSLELKM